MAGIRALALMIGTCVHPGDDTQFFLTDAVGDTNPLNGVFLKRIHVAGIQKSDVVAVVDDLKNGVGALEDSPFDGILGMSFLAGTRFVLNAPERKIEWWRSLHHADHVMSIRYDCGRLPFVTLTYNHKDIPCLVDSGAMGGFELPGALDPAGPGVPVLARGNFGRTTAGECKVVEALASGSAEWPNAPVVFRKDWGIGSVGLDVLAAGPVCFDFIADRLAFELKGAKASGLPLLRPGRSSLPLVWDRSGPRDFLKVGLVKPGSPMEAAGCQVGDELVRVGPLEGKALTRRSVMDWMAKGKPHAWVVRRNGGMKELHFR